MSSDTCGLCTPGLCPHLPDGSDVPPDVHPIEKQRSDVAAERDALKDQLRAKSEELAIATAALDKASRQLAQLEREVLQAYRRSKKVTGSTPRPPKDAPAP